MININIEKDVIKIQEDEKVLGEIKAGAYFRTEDVDMAILDTISIVLESLNIDYNMNLK